MKREEMESADENVCVCDVEVGVGRSMDRETGKREMTRCGVISGIDFCELWFLLTLFS